MLDATVALQELTAGRLAPGDTDVAAEAILKVFQDAGVSLGAAAPDTIPLPALGDAALDKLASLGNNETCVPTSLAPVTKDSAFCWLALRAQAQIVKAAEDAGLPTPPQKCMGDRATFRSSTYPDPKKFGLETMCEYYVEGK